MRGLLNAWKSDFEADRSKYLPTANLSRSVFALFDDFRVELIAKATLVELDYSGTAQQRYKGLVSKIINMTPGQTETGEGKKKLYSAIGDLIDFLRT